MSHTTQSLTLDEQLFDHEANTPDQWRILPTAEHGDAEAVRPGENSL